MLSESDKRTIRQASSYRRTILAARVMFGGVAVLGLLAVLNAYLGVPSAMVVPVAVPLAVTVVLAGVIWTLASIEVNLLRFNLRGRKLFDTTARRQVYAMFLADLVRRRRPDGPAR